MDDLDYKIAEVNEDVGKGQFDPAFRHEFSREIGQNMVNIEGVKEEVERMIALVGYHGSEGWDARDPLELLGYALNHCKTGIREDPHRAKEFLLLWRALSRVHGEVRQIILLWDDEEA